MLCAYCLVYSLQIANHHGYIQIHWHKVKKELRQARRELEKQARGQRIDTEYVVNEVSAALRDRAHLMPRAKTNSIIEEVRQEVTVLCRMLVTNRFPSTLARYFSVLTCRLPLTSVTYRLISFIVNILYNFSGDRLCMRQRARGRWFCCGILVGTCVLA